MRSLSPKVISNLLSHLGLNKTRESFLKDPNLTVKQAEKLNEALAKKLGDRFDEAKGAVANATVYLKKAQKTSLAALAPFRSHLSTVDSLFSETESLFQTLEVPESLGELKFLEELTGLLSATDSCGLVLGVKGERDASVLLDSPKVSQAGPEVVHLMSHYLLVKETPLASYSSELVNSDDLGRLELLLNLRQPLKTLPSSQDLLSFLEDLKSRIKVPLSECLQKAKTKESAARLFAELVGNDCFRVGEEFETLEPKEALRILIEEQGEADTALVWPASLGHPAAVREEPAELEESQLEKDLNSHKLEELNQPNSSPETSVQPDVIFAQLEDRERHLLRNIFDFLSVMGGSGKQNISSEELSRLIIQIKTLSSKYGDLDFDLMDPLQMLHCLQQVQNFDGACILLEYVVHRLTVSEKYGDVFTEALSESWSIQDCLHKYTVFLENLLFYDYRVPALLVVAREHDEGLRDIILEKQDALSPQELLDYLMEVHPFKMQAFLNSYYVADDTSKRTIFSPADFKACCFGLLAETVLDADTLPEVAQLLTVQPMVYTLLLPLTLKEFESTESLRLLASFSQNYYY